MQASVSCDHIVSVRVKIGQLLVHHKNHMIQEMENQLEVKEVLDHSQNRFFDLNCCSALSAFLSLGQVLCHVLVVALSFPLSPFSSVPSLLFSSYSLLLLIPSFS